MKWKPASFPLVVMDSVGAGAEVQNSVIQSKHRRAVTLPGKTGFLQQTPAFVIMALNSSTEYSASPTFSAHQRISLFYAKNGYSLLENRNQRETLAKEFLTSGKKMSVFPGLVMMSSIHFRIYFTFNFVPMCVFVTGMQVPVETRGLCPFGAGVVESFGYPIRLNSRPLQEWQAMLSSLSNS